MPKNETPVEMKPIARLRTPFKTVEEMPIQSRLSSAEGWIDLNAEYVQGLKDLEGFSHLILIYHFHKSERVDVQSSPFVDDAVHGIFAIRSPNRPNHLGMSVVELLRIEGHQVYFKGADMLDGTPLLDLKPYIPEFDSVQNARTGWMTQLKDRLKSARSDDRFK